MNIKKKYTNFTMPLSEAVNDALDGADYDLGRIESLERGLMLTNEFIGQLMQNLLDKEVLSEDEILELLGGQYEKA